MGKELEGNGFVAFGSGNHLVLLLLSEKITNVSRLSTILALPPTMGWGGGSYVFSVIPGIHGNDGLTLGV